MMGQHCYAHFPGRKEEQNKKRYASSILSEAAANTGLRGRNERYNNGALPRVFGIFAPNQVIYAPGEDGRGRVSFLFCIVAARPASTGKLMGAWRFRPPPARRGSHA